MMSITKLKRQTAKDFAFLGHKMIQRYYSSRSFSNGEWITGHYRRCLNCKQELAIIIRADGSVRFEGLTPCKGST